MRYKGNKTELDGILFDSRLEAEYYSFLKESPDVTQIELQPKFVLQEKFIYNLKPIRAIKYTADFKVTYFDGRVEILDVKGYRNELWQFKEKIIKRKMKDLKLDFFLVRKNKQGWIKE